MGHVAKGNAISTREDFQVRISRIPKEAYFHNFLQMHLL
jgi:hypothetical protein